MHFLMHTLIYINGDVVVIIVGAEESLFLINDENIVHLVYMIPD